MPGRPGEPLEADAAGHARVVHGVKGAVHAHAATVRTGPGRPPPVKRQGGGVGRPGFLRMTSLRLWPLTTRSSLVVVGHHGPPSDGPETARYLFVSATARYSAVFPR